MYDRNAGTVDLEAQLIDAVGQALGTSILVFDRNDILLYASSDFGRFFPVSEAVSRRGARLRDLLRAVYDYGHRQGRLFFTSSQHMSRDDWVAERIAVHWRERYESIEQMPDGRWFRVAKRRLPNGVLITCLSDITEQKKRDEALIEMRDQAELAQHILDNLANPVIVKDAELRFVIVNDAFCRLLGFHAKNIIGRRAADLVGAEAAAAFEESERAVLATGVPYEFVEDIRQADGSFARSITRKHRSGTPGHYYVTISINVIREVAPGDGPGLGVPVAAEGFRSPDAKLRRVLVADEDGARRDARAAALQESGLDAYAVCTIGELFQFLRTARAMAIPVDRVEASPSFRSLIARSPEAAEHPALAEFSPQRRGEGEKVPPATASESPSAAKPLSDTPPPAAESPPAEEAVTAPANAPVAAPAAALFTGSPEKVRVLVAEDNDVNQLVFEQILEGIGVDYRIVGNGEQAVRAWRESRPDLILMDVSMPVMNGHQATEAIRAAERQEGEDGVHVPIIAVTAHAMSGDSDKCFAAGMDDFLTKPVSSEQLEAAIANWVSRKKPRHQVA